MTGLSAGVLNTGRRPSLSRAQTRDLLSKT